MRIYLSCQQALKAHPVPAYGFWEYYFIHALQEAGHEVLQAPTVDWAEGLNVLTTSERQAWKDRTWGQTVAYLRTEHAREPVALFLSYLFPDQVEPTAVKEIRSLGIPAVNFFCDNMREFTRIPAVYAGFDLHWVPEAEAQALYQKAGLQYLYAPMAMWVPPALRELPLVEKAGAVFIGSRDELREELLGRASELGLNLKIFGSGWTEDTMQARTPASQSHGKLANQFRFLRQYGPKGLLMKATYRFRDRHFSDWMPGRAPITNEQYFDETRRNALTIGVNRCPSFRQSFGNPLRYSRLRDIEAPMLGACYLTEAAPGIDDLYAVGSEIETYRSAEELAEKAKELLGDVTRRLSLRRKGQRRALAEHTIARTVEKICTRLGLQDSGISPQPPTTR